MIKQLIRISRVGLGSIFILLSGLGLFFGIIAMIDPVGTKLSDDADPFGVPPTLGESLTVTIIYFSLFAVGFLLLVGFNFKLRLEPKRPGCNKRESANESK